MISPTLEQLLISELQGQRDDSLIIENPYDYKPIFLNRILPDWSNSRFLPGVIIDDLHAYQFTSRQISKNELIELYDAADKVLVGKGCIVNCFPKGSSEWKNASSTAESIIELAANIAVSEIIQAPTIYPVDDTHYQLLTGHRRFFALIYVNGRDVVSHFKVYQTKPALLKTKQFQENASRQDLPQYGKLRAFQDALTEIDTLNNARRRMGLKNLSVKEVAGALGISMGAFDNYNVLTRYPSVIKSFEHGNTISLVQMKKVVLRLESNYKRKYNKTKLDIDDKRAIDSKIHNHLTGKVEKVPTTENKKAAPKYFRIDKVESGGVIQRLLQNNILEMDVGVNWQSVDWNNTREVNDALGQVIEFLTKQETE